MIKRKSGKILNVASTAVFLPGPLMADYYASKAYVSSFSEALSNELEGTGVIVSILCPGPTSTGFVQRAHMENLKLFQGKNMDAAKVAEIAYNGLRENTRLIFPGIKNRLMTETIRLVPRNTVLKVVRNYR